MQRFGFASAAEGDFAFTSSFLDLLAVHTLDYTNSFRLLSQFPGIATPLLPTFLDAMGAQDATVRKDLTDFLRTYEARLSTPEEKAAAKTPRAERQDGVNPRFILRQWVLEETIARLDSSTPDVKSLDRVLEMAQNPFEGYGETKLDGAEVCLGEEERERERLCGVGSKAMLGFQCSCSS